MVGCWPERETRGDSAQVEPGRLFLLMLEESGQCGQSGQSGHLDRP